MAQQHRHQIRDNEMFLFLFVTIFLSFNSSNSSNISATACLKQREEVGSGRRFASALASPGMAFPTAVTERKFTLLIHEKYVR